MKEKENVVSPSLELGNPEIESERATTALKFHWWKWDKEMHCDNASKKLRFLEIQFLKLDVIKFQNKFWIPNFFNIPHNFFFFTFSGAFF